ncbi:hypothetical protein [Duganella phyllosphaerae]|uniref:Uncharacterized protein n=1 Tax=Duganella phyllosphaerae TaxID=762836 RepID=A0A1E7W6A7_9BURK|nr:hypothetical protein [Duganella phyllosphaerae]OEZ91527.1 hypothetical protein DUPY_51390 [Duganella phyllosphaerae]
MNDDIKQTPVPAVPAQTGMQSLGWDAVNSAANTANNNFGQWMPERWLQEFVKAYNASIPAQPVQQPAAVAADLAAFNAYFCNTLSCDGVETEQQVEDCRVAAYDAWCEATRRADARAALAAPGAAPVAGQEPFGYMTKSSIASISSMPSDFATFRNVMVRNTPVKSCSTGIYLAHVPAASVQPATITLDGHQLRMALDFINPDGLADRDQLDNDLTFGVRQHRDDDGKVSTGMCCWNDDTDGVLPLDGEYEGHAAVQPDSVSDAALLSAIRNGVPLEEPVSIAKAMMAQVKASTCLDKGLGPLAMVQLVNIQVQPLTHTKETATTYADGFNRGVEWLRSSIIEYADKLAPVNVAQVGELIGLIERTVERLNRAQIFPLASEWNAILAAAKKGPTT